jgi:hypothetical protein
LGLQGKETLMPRKPVENGIFLGRGYRNTPRTSFMDWGFVTIDASGNVVDTESLPEDADMSAYTMGGIALRVGQPECFTDLGRGSTNKLIGAVASENFAHPRMQAQIDQWLTEVETGDELYEKVKEAKGLITLKDVGLDPTTTELPGEEIKGG